MLAKSFQGFPLVVQTDVSFEGFRLILKSPQEGQQVESAGKDTCCQALGREVDPWNPLGRRKELTPAICL